MPINPVNGAHMPDLGRRLRADVGYGTGAIMAVPAHDERDHEFATKFGLPIVQVIAPPAPMRRHARRRTTATASLINSRLPRRPERRRGQGAHDRSGSKERTSAQRKVQYRLRDWLFSRQRYWGEPIPILHLQRRQRSVPLPEDSLPVLPPRARRLPPAPATASRRSRAPATGCATTDPRTGAPAWRETNTMPQWAGSCWYYLRFLDPQERQQALVDPEAERYWMPVDLYVGGAEHAVLHLLYARFWHKVLYDLGAVQPRSRSRGCSTRA